MATDLRSLGRRALWALDVAVGVVGALALVGGWVLVQVGGEAAWRRLEQLVREGPVLDVAALASAALLAANVFVAAGARRPRAPLRFVVSQVPGGPVRIARDALEAALRAAAETIEGVTRARVAIEPAGARRLALRVQIHVPEGASISRVGESARSAVRKRFEELVTLPDGQRADVQLELQGFAGKPVAREEEQPAAPAEEPEPFRGPRYPIPGEEP